MRHLAFLVGLLLVVAVIVTPITVQYTAHHGPDWARSSLNHGEAVAAPGVLVAALFFGIACFVGALACFIASDQNKK